MSIFNWPKDRESVLQRYAYDFDEYDDLFSNVQNLHELWTGASPTEIVLDDQSDIFCAAAMLCDGILPDEAKYALGKVFIKAMGEILDKKYHVSSLGLRPPKKGRKRMSSATSGYIIHSVAGLKLEGATATEAYEKVSKNFNKSPDTIRRMYERSHKERLGKGRKGLP